MGTKLDSVGANSCNDFASKSSNKDSYKYNEDSV